MVTKDIKGGGGLGTMLKAALPALPGVNQVPGIKKSGNALPDLTVTTKGTVERAHVDAYARICGFESRDTAPLTYLHMLAFPLHMGLMTDGSWPFPAIGTVHVENAISQHRRVSMGESIALTGRATNLRPHAKGRLFDIEVSASADGETIWESRSTYLRIGKGDKENGDRGITFNEVPAGGIPWKLPEDLGRRYGAISGDRNPIHLYPLTAKAFGFPRHIAHGMWSKARSVAAIENRLPEAVRVEVGFKKPIFLPGTVSLGVADSETGLDFSLTSPKNGAVHLLGRTSPL